MDKLAAEKGFLDAQMQLAYLYQIGFGTELVIKNVSSGQKQLNKEMILLLTC